MNGLPFGKKELSSTNPLKRKQTPKTYAQGILSWVSLCLVEQEQRIFLSIRPLSASRLPLHTASERPKPASSSRRKWLSNCFSCRSYSSKRCFFLLVLLSVQNFPTESFIHLLKAEGALADSWELRPVKYLNHLVEQDHRFLKRLVKPGLGFFSPETA